MFKKIYSLVIKEFLAVWQDKKSRFYLIIPPIIQLFIFAFAATLDVKNVSIAILNKDDGKLSHELIERFKGSPTFSHIRYLKRVQEIKDVIDNQKVSMVIHINEDFSRNLLSGKNGEVQLILDGRKSNSTQIIQGYASKIIGQFYDDLSSEMQFSSPSSVLIPRNWFNSNLEFTWFTVPGLVAILTLTTSLIVTALTIARERELGTFEQLLVSPLRPVDILLGKAIPGIIVGMCEGTIILLAAVLAFGVPFTGSLSILYFSMFIFVTSIVGVGLFLSSLCKTQQQALLAVMIFISVTISLSGFSTPIENMPAWLQDLTYFNPLRHFLVIVRGVFLKDMPIGIVLKYVYPMLFMAVVSLFVSSWFFRRRLE